MPQMLGAGTKTAASKQEGSSERGVAGAIGAIAGAPGWEVGDQAKVKISRV